MADRAERRQIRNTIPRCRTFLILYLGIVIFSIFCIDKIRFCRSPFYVATFMNIRRERQCRSPYTSEYIQVSFIQRVPRLAPSPECDGYRHPMHAIFLPDAHIRGQYDTNPQSARFRAHTTLQSPSLHPRANPSPDRSRRQMIDTFNDGNPAIHRNVGSHHALIRRHNGTGCPRHFR